MPGAAPNPGGQEPDRIPPGPDGGLVEVGTHVVYDATVDSHRGQERVLAERLAGSLRPGMLVMAEHGLPDAHLWQRLATTGADLLWRIPAMWTIPVEQVLPDGSWISTLRVGRNGGLRIPRDVRVRVVECVPEIAGRKRAGRHHLITRSWTSNGSGHGNSHALRRTRA